MKAQKIGLVLGLNLAAACCLMQGCKAVKPETKQTIPEALAVTVEPDPQPAAAPAPAPVVQEVKPLPPPAKKPAPAVKPLPPPAKPAPVAEEGVVHVVRAGELLSRISRDYNVKMSAILSANPGLNADRIRVGQKIRIPGAKAAAVKAAPAESAAVSVTAAKTTPPKRAKRAFKAYTGATKEYTVKSGDSLGKIAYENGITIRALKELNGLTKDTLRIGQKLKVPAEKQTVEKKAKTVKAEAAPKPEAAPAQAPAAQATEVKPQPPAAAEAPAKEEDKKPDAANAPQAPAAEQAADVPPPPPAPAAESLMTYTVKPGDDLVSISVAWGLSPSQLLNVNDIKEGEALQPGQVLRLPPNAKRMEQP